MAEYSFDAATFKAFGARPYPADAAGRFAYWADFADSLGPSMLAFLVQPGKWDGIPFTQLGVKKFRPSDLVPQPKEMWILFCLRQDGIRQPSPADSPLRQDGFPLVLEWRRDTTDSPLLSPAFHDLAQKVREQLGAPGWGLHPAFGRYGDKVSFADPGLFSDVEHASSIASAWGALATGLFCATRDRWPRVWPFPTIQWNRKTDRTAGVAGLREKLAVASDFGAEIVSVDQSQLRAARAELRALRKRRRPGGAPPPALFGVPAGSPAATADRIASGSQWKSRRRRRLLAALHVLPVLAAAAFAAAWYVHWEARRVSEQAFREILHSLSVHAGAYNAAIEAQNSLLLAARHSVETGSGRRYSAALTPFKMAMDTSRDTMKKARTGEDAAQAIRKSAFDSSLLTGLFDETASEIEQAELTLPLCLEQDVLSARLPPGKPPRYFLDQEETRLACNAEFYVLGVMRLLASSRPDEIGDFMEFARNLRFLPRFSGPWLFDPTTIDAELEAVQTRLERLLETREAELKAGHADFAREEKRLEATLLANGISPEEASSILDSLAELSAKKSELNYVTNKVDLKKRDFYRKHKPLAGDDDELLWGKMLAFKSHNMPEGAWEAMDILERRESDMYRPGAIRAAKAMVDADQDIPFTNGIMVLSFAPPATSHALFRPGDVVVGFDDRQVDWFPDYKSVPGSSYRFWRLGEDGTFALHEGILPPGQPLTAFEDVNPKSSDP